MLSADRAGTEATGTDGANDTDPPRTPPARRHRQRLIDVDCWPNVAAFSDVGLDAEIRMRTKILQNNRGRLERHEWAIGLLRAERQRRRAA